MHCIPLLLQAVLREAIVVILLALDFFKDEIGLGFDAVFYVGARHFLELTECLVDFMGTLKGYIAMDEFVLLQSFEVLLPPFAGFAVGRCLSQPWILVDDMDVDGDILD